MSIKRVISPIAALVVLSALMAPAAAGATRPAAGKTTMVLCSQLTPTAAQLHETKVIVSRRIRHGFHFKQAIVTVKSSCIMVTLPHPVGWIRWLAADVASGGRFGIGVAYPNAKTELTPGEIVRYKKDALTSANDKLQVVKVVLGRPAFVGWSAKLQVRDGYEYVGVRLTPQASRTLCTFTSNTSKMAGGLAVVVLDHQVITDEQVTVKICGGSLLTGFPKSKSLDKPLGPRELVADLHSGSPLPVALTVTSLS